MLCCNVEVCDKATKRRLGCRPTLHNCTSFSIDQCQTTHLVLPMPSTVVTAMPCKETRGVRQALADMCCTVPSSPLRFRFKMGLIDV